MVRLDPSKLFVSELKSHKKKNGMNDSICQYFRSTFRFSQYKGLHFCRGGHWLAFLFIIKRNSIDEPPHPFDHNVNCYFLGLNDTNAVLTIKTTWPKMYPVRAAFQKPLTRSPGKEFKFLFRASLYCTLRDRDVVHFLASISWISVTGTEEPKQKDLRVCKA